MPGAAAGLHPGPPEGGISHCVNHSGRAVWLRFAGLGFSPARLSRVASSQFRRVFAVLSRPTVNVSGPLRTGFISAISASWPAAYPLADARLLNAMFTGRYSVDHAALFARDPARTGP